MHLERVLVRHAHRRRRDRSKLRCILARRRRKERAAIGDMAEPAWPVLIQNNNSPPAATSGWLDKICSTGVVSDRGMPTINTGRGNTARSSAPPVACYINAAENVAICRSTRADHSPRSNGRILARSAFAVSPRRYAGRCRIGGLVQQLRTGAALLERLEQGGQPQSRLQQARHQRHRLGIGVGGLGHPVGMLQRDARQDVRPGMRGQSASNLRNRSTACGARPLAIISWATASNGSNGATMPPYRGNFAGAATVGERSAGTAE